MQSASLRKIVEASYRLSGPSSGWLEHLGLATEAAFGQGYGTVAALIDATDPRSARIVEYASTRQIPNLDRLLEDTVSILDPSYVEDAKRAGASLATEEGGMQQPGLQMFTRAFGANDLLTILAMDASGHGTIIATNLAEPAVADVRQSTTLSQLAAHVLSGYRLRENDLALNEAVFTVNGDPVDVSDVVREAGALAELTKAVRALDVLRKSRADDHRALGRFTSRVDATWSVVAEVEHGDAQWIVAKRNLPKVLPLPETLSQREREVMSLLLLGRSPKIVAYELGIAHSTVRVLISRALAKLGATNVDEVRTRFTPS